MKHFAVKLIIGLLVFVLGATATYATIVHWRFYAVPDSILSEQGDGCSVSFVYYLPEKIPVIGDRNPTTIVMINDWKNNAPIKKIVHRGATIGQDRLFYSDGDLIVALAGGHTIYNYDKKSRIVKTEKFAEQYELFDLLPDKKRIIARDSTTLGMVVLDWGGNILSSLDVSALGELSDRQLYNNGNKMVFRTGGMADLPLRLFVWDINKNIIAEEKEKSVIESLSYSSFEVIYGDPAVYLTGQKDGVTKTIKLDD